MPLYIPDYTDNERNLLLAVLDSLISEYQERNLDVATGFFSPEAWGLLKDSLSQLEAFRLMIGKELEASQPKEGLDLAKHYRKLIRSDLETATYTPQRVAVIDSLIAFLRREEVDVKLFDDPFLHAKAYIFDNYSLVGSSNLTVNGLRHNSELNLVNKNRAVAQDMRVNWFNRFWERATPYKDELIDVLDKSKFGSYQYSPFDLFIKVLFENFRDSISPEDTSQQAVELAAFQQEGFRLARSLLDRHGSVMVADAVGLGKTYLGLSILEEYVINRRRPGYVPRALVVCPAQLEDLVWEPRLQEFGIAARIVSMESMGREDFNWKAYLDVDVIVVDESHNFRKASTGRYQNLMRIVGSGKPDKKIALLTATPVNNNVFDMYYQVRLMARGRDDFYREQGISSLLMFFKRLAVGAGEFYDLVEHTLVRRSRRDVKRRQEQGEKVVISGREIRFPERTLHRIDYSLFDQLGGFYEGFVQRIENLNLVAYNLERYKRDADDTEVKKREALAGIFKTNFLKRLESSLQAFVTSVDNQQRFQQRFYDLFVEGRLLDAGTQRKLEQILRLLDTEDESGQDAQQRRLEQVLSSLPVVERKDYRIAEMEGHIRADLAALEWMRERVRVLLESQSDAKLSTLKQTLMDLKGEKVIVFSYYHDTARYLYDGLKNDSTWMQEAGEPPIAVISGTATKKQERKLIVERFAPKANRGDMTDELFAERLADPVQLLISTDVLSEGQNLQDAGYLINADLHWNPVRMIQRAGRIDRLGSDFEKLHIYNVFPEAGLEELLGLVDRLETRIRDIDRTVGLDASVLGEVISGKSFDELRRIRALDASIIDELEGESELADGDELRLPLVAALQAIGQDYVDSLPMGIHSAKPMPEGAKGVFIALKAREQVYWRVFDLEGDGAPLTSKRSIFRLIRTRQDAPRSVDPKSIEIFPFIERAVNHVLKGVKRETKRQAFKAPLTGVAKELYGILSDIFVAQALEETLHKRLLSTVENRSFAAFERDPELKAIVEGYGAQQDVKIFAQELDAFFALNQLHIEQDTRKEMLRTLQAEDITLIGYEWLI